MKLTKKFLKDEENMKHRELSISVCGLYLTNGVWLAEKRLFCDIDLVKDVDSLKLKFGKLASDSSGPDVEKFLEFLKKDESEEVEEFDRTRWAQRGKNNRPYDLYRGSRGSILFVASRYADFFGLDKLYGHFNTSSKYLQTMPVTDSRKLENFSVMVTPGELSKSAAQEAQAILMEGYA